MFHDKNRCQNKDLSELRYNIYGKSLSGDLLNGEAVLNIQSQMNQPDGIVWEDVTVTI